MIQFNELRITADGRNLLVDAQVRELDYYDNVYIDSILYDTQSTFVAGGPSSKAVTLYKAGDDENVKHVRVTENFEDTSETMFFVYAIAKGTPSDDTPCGLKEQEVMGIAFNEYSLYLPVMKMLNELEGCNPPANLLNFSLRLKAFEMAIKTGNYSKAIEYWNKFFKENTTVVTSNCGCNG